MKVETQDGKTQDARQEQASDELLTRLVDLNRERAAEEKRGLIRYLRPDYQNPVGRAGLGAPTSSDLPGTETTSSTASPKHRPTETPAPWPSTLSAQVTAIQKLLLTHGPDPETLSAHFGRKSPKRTQQVAEILETLQGLGKL